MLKRMVLFIQYVVMLVRRKEKKNRKGQYLRLGRKHTDVEEVKLSREKI